MTATVTQFPRRNPKAHPEWVLITPALAREWLENDTINRPINQERVERYAQEMRQGRWDEDNGETLKLSPTKGILDGQHRLWALCEAEATLRFLVVFDVDKESFKTIDIGMGRTPGQVAGMAGVKNANNATATAGLILALTDKVYGMEGRYAPTQLIGRTRILEWTIANATVLHESVKLSLQCAKIVSISYVAAVHYLAAHREDPPNKRLPDRPALATSFVEQLAKGHFDDRVADTAKHPIFVLREKLVANRMSTSKMNPPAQVGLIIKGWNLYKERKPITPSGLRVTMDEKYPEVR